MQGASKMFSHIKSNKEILNDFDIFLAYMKLGVNKVAFDNIIEKNKKKFISRCYMLFDTLRNTDKIN